MVQYANPHPNQPRSQYTGHPAQPQPAPSYGTISTGPDGRPWQLTPQGWVPYQQAPQGYPQPGYPHPGPGYSSSQGQPYPVYPYHGQPQPQTSYPPYMPPGHSSLPTYDNRQLPQPGSHPSQQSTRSANRFGGSDTTAQPAPQTPVAMPTYTPAAAQSHQPTTQGEKDMQLVSTGKTTMPKTILNASGFKTFVRTNVFDKNSVVFHDPLMITDCLDELVEQAIEYTANHERSPAALIASGVVEMIYHKATQSKYLTDLFQPDVKLIYKAFKTHLTTVNNRYDLVYLSAINNYLTQIVNDTLYPILGHYPTIDSFHEDFNELLRTLRNNCSAEVEDLFVEQVNEVMKKTQANFTLSENLVNEDAPEPDEGAADTAEQMPQRALIPMPVQVICLNYISTELGSDDNLAKMLVGLTDILDSHVAYVCTIDKTVYKAFFSNEKVLLDLIRN